MLHPSRRQLEAIVRDPEGRQISRCLVQRGRYILGSDHGNEILVDDPSVSGKHARLTVVSDDEFYIEDRTSANGTLIDGKPAEGLARITLESRVQLGGCTFEFQRGGLPAAVFQHLPDGFLRAQRYNFGEMAVQGRTSTIFEAYDTTLLRDVAIKVIRPESQANVEHVLRFIREAQITSQLQHPGILTVYELGLNEQSQLFYSTRFVEGESLGSVLDALAERDTRALARHSLATLLTAFQRACDAVAFAHSRGVVHGGLRPDTINLGAFGELIVVNWCFARVGMLNEAGEPFAHPVLAAPVDALPPLSAYTAPEMAEGDWDRVGVRSDVYSLGGILYRLLTLRAPLAADDDAEMRRLISAGCIPALASSAREKFAHCPSGRIPDTLAAIAQKALSPRPEDRFACVPEMQQALLAWQNGSPRGSR